MSRVVHKYPLRPHGITAVVMPAAAEIRAVMLQDLQPCVWTEVRPDTTFMRDYQFLVVHTGEEIPDHIDGGYHWKYLGTAQDKNGWGLHLVLHVYLQVPN